MKPGANWCVPKPWALNCGRSPIHPALLDACTQLVGALLGPVRDCLYLPLQYRGVRLNQAVPERFWCHARVREANESAKTIAFDLTLYDVDGMELGGIASFVVKRAPRETLLRGLATDRDRLLHQIRWLDQSPLKPSPSGPIEASDGSWLVCGAGAADLGRILADRGLKLETSDGRAVAGAPIPSRKAATRGHLAGRGPGGRRTLRGGGPCSQQSTGRAVTGAGAVSPEPGPGFTARSDNRDPTGSGR